MSSSHLACVYKTVCLTPANKTTYPIKSPPRTKTKRYWSTPWYHTTKNTNWNKEKQTNVHMSNLPRQTKTQTYHINNVLPHLSTSCFDMVRRARDLFDKEYVLDLIYQNVSGGYNWMGFISFHMPKDHFPRALWDTWIISGQCDTTWCTQNNLIHLFHCASTILR